MIKYSVRKNGIITNSWTSKLGDHTHYEPCFGKPERIVLHKDEQGAEPYDDADVLEERLQEISPAIEAILDDEGVEISPAVPAVVQKMVKLRAEYTIEIIDLDQDLEYLLQQCHAKRKAEYPSLGEFADAFVKMQNGDSSQMEAYVASCLAVKAKYPKP
jgi:hypothetical protein